MLMIIKPARQPIINGSKDVRMRIASTITIKGGINDNGPYKAVSCFLSPEDRKSESPEVIK